MGLRFLMIGSVLIFLNGNSLANDKLAHKDVLSVAETAGACFILDAQIGFQKQNNVSGVWGFIKQFWDTEAARRGTTREQLLKACTDSMKAYVTIRELANSPGN